MGSQIFKLSPTISENPKFRSYSWSANVCGKKRWILISPVKVILCLAATFTCNNTKSCVHNISVSETNVPGFSKAIWLECIQEPNEIIFVPSGWYHQVHNLEDRISINHNWFNAYNLHWVLSGTLLQWDWLLREYYEAKEYIEDIKDICDLKVSANATLAANTGLRSVLPRVLLNL